MPLPVTYKLPQLSLAFIFSIVILASRTFERSIANVLCRPRRRIIISALRAYYTDKIDFENFTDSRSLLDILTSLELATSIVVASSLVLWPVLKKWFGHSTHKSDTFGTVTSPKSSKYRFQRMEDIGLDAAGPGPQQMKLGIRTTAEQGPKRTSLDLPLHGSRQPDSFFTELERLAVHDGEGISVRKDLTRHEGA
ncbi:MAG: hypothetical protein Q9193_004875 [Seirophora villosa]